MYWQIAKPSGRSKKYFLRKNEGNGWKSVSHPKLNKINSCSSKDIADELCKELLVELRANNIKTRKCRVCNLIQAESAFCKEETRCRTCESTRQRKLNKKKSNTSKHRAAVRDSGLRTRYNISTYQYELMLLAQEGCCAMCGKAPYGLDAWPEDREDILVVDHDHKTGNIRGLLCATCNSTLGICGDTREGVQSALKQGIHYLYNIETGKNKYIKDIYNREVT